MKFTLKSVSNSFNKKSEKDEVEELRKLGFEFTETDYGDGDIILFTVEDQPLEIEINKIEELVSLVEKVGGLIVFKGSISIYNGYYE